jgi:hypothetical protein
MRSLSILVFLASIGFIGVLFRQAYLQEHTQQATLTVTSPVKPTTGKKTGGDRGRAGKKPHRPERTAAGIGPQISIGEQGARKDSLPPDVNPATTAGSSRVIPDPEKMEIGTTRAELKAQYGAPTFAVAGVREGDLLERYFYLKPDHANLVVARLRDGRLVSAENVRMWQPQHNLRNSDQ